MFLTTINVFATVGTDNSNMILSMPIIKIIIVIVAGIIIVTLLYNVSQDTTSNTKELIKQMEKSENNKKYNKRLYFLTSIMIFFIINVKVPIVSFNSEPYVETLSKT